ncbi:hypothetical protein J6590_082310 [Homalodisca vitripennis]|nr:hypothetical protein J6590_082310 [Homalodisca vitripennis]
MHNRKASGRTVLDSEEHEGAFVEYLITHLHPNYRPLRITLLTSDVSSSRTTHSCESVHVALGRSFSSPPSKHLCRSSANHTTFNNHSSSELYRQFWCVASVKARSGEMKLAISTLSYIVWVSHKVTLIKILSISAEGIHPATALGATDYWGFPWGSHLHPGLLAQGLFSQFLDMFFFASRRSLSSELPPSSERRPHLNVRAYRLPLILSRVPLNHSTLSTADHLDILSSQNPSPLPLLSLTSGSSQTVASLGKGNGRPALQAYLQRYKIHRGDQLLDLHRKTKATVSQDPPSSVESDHRITSFHLHILEVQVTPLRVTTCRVEQSSSNNPRQHLHWEVHFVTKFKESHWESEIRRVYTLMARIVLRVEDESFSLMYVLRSKAVECEYNLLVANVIKISYVTRK